MTTYSDEVLCEALANDGYKVNQKNMDALKQNIENGFCEIQESVDADECLAYLFENYCHNDLLEMLCTEYLKYNALCEMSDEEFFKYLKTSNYNQLLETSILLGSGLDVVGTVLTESSDASAIQILDEGLIHLKHAVAIAPATDAAKKITYASSMQKVGNGILTATKNTARGIGSVISSQVGAPIATALAAAGVAYGVTRGVKHIIRTGKSRGLYAAQHANDISDRSGVSMDAIAGYAMGKRAYKKKMETDAQLAAMKDPNMKNLTKDQQKSVIKHAKADAAIVAKDNFKNAKKATQLVAKSNNDAAAISLRHSHAKDAAEYDSANVRGQAADGLNASDTYKNNVNDFVSNAIKQAADNSVTDFNVVTRAHNQTTAPDKSADQKVAQSDEEKPVSKA